MKKLIFLLAYCLAGCINCATVDCGPPYASFEFSYLSKDGVNLLDCENPTYRLEDFKIYSFINSNDTLFATVQLSYDDCSRIFVELNYSNEESYLLVKNKQTDTLKFKFKIDTGGCCDSSDIIEASLNGTEQSVDNPIQIKERN
jgi:hypothetical protein